MFLLLWRTDSPELAVLVHACLRQDDHEFEVIRLCREILSHINEQTNLNLMF